MSDLARRMMDLFRGYRGAHGTHGDMKRNPEKGGKMEIKKTARTLREPVTEELWQRHLDGEYFLGIMPITEEEESWFGCIDVDRYDVNLGEIVAELKKRRIPMIVCRSKSGGAHVYLFLREAVPAEDIRARLSQIAASMGWGDCEIFPKQSRILSNRGDLANWINMPYHNMKNTDRYGVKQTMAAMTIEEFLTVAERSRVTLDKVSSPSGTEDDTMEDGPPCLQHLCDVGFPEGQRNNGFLAMATFCKKKFGANWAEKLEEYNRRYFDPPRSADEVADVIRRLKNKDYNYRCKDVPLCSYCNSSLCRTRKFGVGGAGHYPTISGLSKLDTDEPIWFLDIDDTRIELRTRQLLNYRDFQAACMDMLTKTFMPMKAETWLQMVGEAMESAIIIEAAPEMSVRGQFLELLHDFLLDRHRGERAEDILLGKPWYDESGERHYFQLRDLMTFLERSGFRHQHWGRNKVGSFIREELGDKVFMNISGHGRNVWWVRAGFEEIPETPLPGSQEDPI